MTNILRVTTRIAFTLTWCGLGFLHTAPAGRAVAAELPPSGQYARPATLPVEWSTPAGDQLHWNQRRLPADRTPLLLQPSTAEAAKQDGMRVWRLRFVDATGDTVPVLLAVPAQGKPPFPLVVVLHAIYCDKAQVMGQFGPALTAKGFCVLAPDLPCHGERAGAILQLINPADARAADEVKKRAVIDVRQCIDLAEDRPGEIDVRGGVSVVGYSLGAWIACFTAEHEERISTIALCLAGSPSPQALAAAPRFAPLDAAAALGHFKGPLFMANARRDQLIPRAWTEGLFEAANRPKTLNWYESGHFDLPRAAADDSVDFVVRQHAQRETAPAGAGPETGSAKTTGAR